MRYSQQRIRPRSVLRLIAPLRIPLPLGAKLPDPKSPGAAALEHHDVIAVNSRVGVATLGKPPLRRSGWGLRQARGSLGAFRFQIKDFCGHAILDGTNLGFKTGRSGTIVTGSSCSSGRGGSCKLHSVIRCIVSGTATFL